MTPSAIIKHIRTSYSIKKSDAEVLLKVAQSNKGFEIDFPDSLSDAERQVFLDAYAETLKLVEESDSSEDSLLKEMIQFDSPVISIQDVVDEVQKGVNGHFKASENGLTWGESHTSQIPPEAFLSLICRLYASLQKTRKIKEFLSWAIADACNMAVKSGKLSMDEIIDQVSSVFKMSAGHLRENCRIARIVPVYMRVPGWTQDQYAVVIRYAPDIENDFYWVMKQLAKGREVELSLSCGAKVKSHSPFKAEQVESFMLKHLGGKRRTRIRSNTQGYLYLSPMGTQFSQTLDRKALKNPNIQIIDLSAKAHLQTGGAKKELPQYDPDVVETLDRMLMNSRS
jgi:hypothetical protein